MRSPSPRSKAARDARDGLLLVLPTLIVIGFVVVLPFVRSLLFALQDVRLVDIPRLSWFAFEPTLDNLADVLDDPGFWEAVRTTCVYAGACTLGTLGLGLAISLSLRRPFRGRRMVRALLLVPYVLPVVAATTVWEAMLNPQFGVVNVVGTRVLGWDRPISFLSTTDMEVAGVTVPVAFTTVIVFELWKTTPLAFLFITARLQAVSAELEEAATIDGATPSQTFRHVILPQLTGVLLLLGLLRFIWSFQNFNDIYLLTSGSAGTEVIAVRVYNELIRNSDVGTASALGLLMTLVLVAFLVLYVQANRRVERAAS
jgi:multiple sugar transport system permease protein